MIVLFSFDAFLFLIIDLAILSKLVKGLQEQFTQASTSSNDICNLLGEGSSVQMGEETKDEGGMSPICERWQSRSNPDSEHTP